MVCSWNHGRARTSAPVGPWSSSLTKTSVTKWARPWNRRTRTSRNPVAIAELINPAESNYHSWLVGSRTGAAGGRVMRRSALFDGAACPGSRAHHPHPP